MNFKEYQEKAQTTAVYPKERGVEYATLGLVGEAGEIANKVKKILRGDHTTKDIQEELEKELGDVLWYCAALATELDLELDVVATKNIDKLLSRKQRGKIKGSGDNR